MDHAAPYVLPTVASVLTLDVSGPAYSGKTGGSPKVRRHSSSAAVVSSVVAMASDAPSSNMATKNSGGCGDALRPLASPESSSHRLTAQNTQPPTPSGKAGGSSSTQSPALPQLQIPPAASRRLNFTGNIDVDDTQSNTPASATPTASRMGGQRGGSPPVSSSPANAVLSPPNVSFGMGSGVDPTSFAMPYRANGGDQPVGSPQLVRSSNSGLVQRSPTSSQQPAGRHARGSSKPGDAAYGAPGGSGLETILGSNVAGSGGGNAMTASGAMLCNVRPTAPLRIGVVQIAPPPLPATSQTDPTAAATSPVPPASLVAATAAIRTFMFPTIPSLSSSSGSVKGSVERTLTAIVEEFTSLIASSSDHAAYADYVALSASGHSGLCHSSSSQGGHPRSRSQSAGVAGRMRLSNTLQEAEVASSLAHDNSRGLAPHHQPTQTGDVGGSTLSDTLMPQFSAEAATSQVLTTDGETSSGSPLLENQPTQLMLSGSGDGAMLEPSALPPIPAAASSMPPPPRVVLSSFPAWSVTPAYIVKESATASNNVPLAPHPKYNHRRSESSSAGAGRPGATTSISTTLHFGSAPPAGGTTTPCIVVVQPFINGGNILDRYQSWSSRGASTRPSRVDQEIVIRRILWSVLEQLAVIHAAGEVHGSVKATNVFAWRDVVEAQQAAATGAASSLQDNEDASFHAALGARTSSTVGGARRRSSKARHAAMGPLDWCTDAVLVDGMYHRLDEAARRVFEREGGASSNGGIALPTEWGRLQDYDYVLPPECLQRTAAADITLATAFDGSTSTAGFTTGSLTLNQQQNTTTSSGTIVPESPFSMSVVSQGSISKRLSVAADLWNVGLLAIHLADGGFPSWLRRQAKPVPSLSSSSGWSNKFHSFVQVCVSLQPDQRSSARELLEDPWFQSVVMPTPPSDAIAAASGASVIASRQNLAILPRNDQEEALLSNSLLQHLHLRANGGGSVKNHLRLGSDPDGQTAGGGGGDGSPSAAGTATAATAAAAAQQSRSPNSFQQQPSAISRPLRQLFEMSEDGRRVFLPQRNYLQTMAELEYCCLQQVVATKRSLEVHHRGLVAAVTLSPSPEAGTAPRPNGNITMPSQLLPTVTIINKASMLGTDDAFQLEGGRGDEDPTTSALQRRPRKDSLDSGTAHPHEYSEQPCDDDGTSYLFGPHVTTSTTTGMSMIDEYNAMMARLGSGGVGGAQGELSSRQHLHSARSRSSSDLHTRGTTAGPTAAAAALSHSSNSGGMDVAAFMLSGGSDSTQQPWGNTLEGGVGSGSAVPWLSNDNTLVDKYASIASSTAMMGMGGAGVGTSIFRAPVSPRKPYVPGEPLPTLSPLSSKPPFLAAFLATMESCRREALQDCGYMVVTTSTNSTSSSIPLNESILTIEGNDLTPTQRREVDMVDFRFAGLTQAFLDLYDIAPICGDQWIMSILQAMRKHAATEDLIEPVVRCWTNSKLKKQQDTSANHNASSSGPGGSALGGASQPQNPSSSNNMKKVSPPSLSTAAGVGGGNGESAIAEPPAVVLDASPTDFNNYLFSKWMTLGTMTLQER